ncbi:MAG TPA: CTP synthase, partial [Bacteroidales bacterium]|nr:CTP synthase [Bacteroidales bacterium]
KPTQHSVKMLLESGVQPDVIVCRTEKHLNQSIRNKIALFCNVNPSAVIESVDVETIYDVPLLMREERLDQVVLEKMQVPIRKQPDLKRWEEFVRMLKNPLGEVQIGLVGKYVELRDAYKSITESFIHAGAANQYKVNLRMIHSESINDSTSKHLLKDLDAILVAPGFGERGIDGKIIAIRFARENKIPFLGICLGMQCAVIEFGRNVLGYKDAHSTEMNPSTEFPVIDIMEEQKNVDKKGGTMRLGLYPCSLKPGSKIINVYQSAEISERHRHRFEFNNKYLEAYEKAGMIATGMNKQNNLVEIIELKDHPWFIGVQFHPEYKSTVAAPHPLFVDFVKAAIQHKKLQIK